MAAYTHWDLVFNFVARIYITEVYFFAPDGTDNVTVGGTASTKMGTTSPASHAFDRNTSNYTDPGSNGLVFGANLQYAHGSPVEVSQVGVRWYYWPDWAGARTSMVLRASNDGVTYDSFGLINTSDAPASAPADRVIRFAVVPYTTSAAPEVLSVRGADVRFAGDGIVAGHVKVEGAVASPLYARVTLLSARDRTPVAEMWTDPLTGAYAFSGLDRQARFLLAVFEPSGSYVPGLSKVVTPV